jgi:hypothetical protein
MSRKATVPAALLATAIGAGCASLPPVEAWQRGELARPEMRFDATPLESRLSEQVWTSKEGSAGGSGVGGGGCGCN